MNERIRELMVTAIYDVDHIYHPVDNPLNEEVSKMYIPDCFAEKFAELIVRECAEVARLNTRIDSKLYLMIKQHFGVEE